MGIIHEAPNITPELLAQEKVLLADPVDLLAIAPDLVWRSGKAVRPARGAVTGLLRLPVAVQPEDGTEGSPLEPADEQFPEFGTARVPPVEAADVGGPPRDPG